MNDPDTVTLILQNLYTSEDYSRSVLPHLKEEYFQEKAEEQIFNVIRTYIEDYNELPSKAIVLIELDNLRGVHEETLSYFSDFFTDESSKENADWLFDKTEEFCKDMALHNAIRKAVAITQGESKELSKTAIPDLLKTALSVSFDTSIGHDYINDIDRRYEYYAQENIKVRFLLEAFNQITGNGIVPKSLMVLMGGPATGKSLFLTHLAVDFMYTGKKVLYITMEMSEEKIEERYDSNVLDIDISELDGIDKTKYYEIADKKRKESFGNIITKEYPTGSANVNHFRFLLNELKLKKNYIPDIIMIDYLNICSSSRISASSGANSYTMIKAVVEELRGLAVEFNVPIITATQANRGGYRSSDIDMTDVSESFGTAMTADYVLGIVATDELDEVGQIGLKVVKNRYGAAGDFYKLNITKSLMRLSDANVERLPQMENISTPNKPKRLAKLPQIEGSFSTKKDKLGGFKL